MKEVSEVVQSNYRSHKAQAKMGCMFTHIHVQDNIVTQVQQSLANLHGQESGGPSSEDEMVGHDRDSCCS